MRSSIAWRLLQGEHSPLLVCLCEFLRQRVNSVVDFFDHQVPSSEVRRVETAVAARALHHNESPKPLVKLLAIYELGAAHLETIHFNYAWRKFDSFLEYEIKDGLPANAVQALVAAIDQLVMRLEVRGYTPDRVLINLYLGQLARQGYVRTAPSTSWGRPWPTAPSSTRRGPRRRS